MDQSQKIEIMWLNSWINSPVILTFEHFVPIVCLLLNKTWYKPRPGQTVNPPSMCRFASIHCPETYNVQQQVRSSTTHCPQNEYDGTGLPRVFPIINELTGWRWSSRCVDSRCLLTLPLPHPNLWFYLIPSRDRVKMKSEERQRSKEEGIAALAAHPHPRRPDQPISANNQYSWTM